MNAPDPNAPPPASPPGEAARWFPFALAVVGFLVLGLCLIGAARTKIRADAEDEVTREWDSPARQLYATVAGAPEGEAAPRQGTLLPIRVDEQSQKGRVDFHVFLALPEEWLPRRGAPPAQVVVLRYRDAELRHYGQTAKGGDRIRYRQACTLELYDLARKELIAKRELLSPDALPEDYGSAAQLSVPAELVVAELRALSR